MHMKIHTSSLSFIKLSSSPLVPLGTPAWWMMFPAQGLGVLYKEAAAMMKLASFSLVALCVVKVEAHFLPLRHCFILWGLSWILFIPSISSSSTSASRLSSSSSSSYSSLLILSSIDLSFAFCTDVLISVWVRVDISDGVEALVITLPLSECSLCFLNL